MSDNKITPGDWEVIDLGCSYSVRTKEHGIIIATCSARSNPVENQIAIANARLIAAAPDLFAALQSLADFAENHIELVDQVEAANAAIAKATGAP